GVTYGSRRVARIDAQPPDGGKGPCSTPEGSRISMSDRGIAKVSATPAGVGMVGPADRWLLAGARNHRLPYAPPSGVDTAGHSFTEELYLARPSSFEDEEDLISDGKSSSRMGKGSPPVGKGSSRIGKGSPPVGKGS